MKVLWVCTSPVGPMARALGIDYQGSSGGWIGAEYDKLTHSTHELVFLTMIGSVDHGTVLRKEYENASMYYIGRPKVTFGIEPPEWMHRSVRQVIGEVCPDIIQIWGTESVLSVAAAACDTGAQKLLFLQGIIGLYVRYKRFALSGEEKLSLRYKLADTVKSRMYHKQASLEEQILKQVSGVILDNDFSEGYCTRVNPTLHTIRYPLLPQQVYFRNRWADDMCEPHSIFTIAGSSPMKGLHLLLSIVSRLTERYPDIRLYVPGTFSRSLREKSGNPSNEYEKLLYRIISEKHLEDTVVFTGKLDAQQMAAYMCRCALFVNPSCTEVHALSLREAMAVGMPCISSVCGSVSEFVFHADNGLLYRYTEPEICESYIIRLFENREERCRLSERAHNTWAAVEGHDLSAVYDAIER